MFRKIEGPQMPTRPTPPICPQCGWRMKLMRTIPALGVLPTLFAFYCAECRETETIAGASSHAPVCVGPGDCAPSAHDFLL
jgi:hypothetical protein